MLRRGLLALALATGAAGCAWFGDDEGIFVDRSDDYVDAALDRELEVPADLQKERLQDPFPIPPSPRVARAQYYPGKAPLPDAIYSGNNREEVRIQRISDRRWLVVPEPPTTVWPKIKQFMADNGVNLPLELGQQGRLNTEWLTIGDEERQDVVGLVIQEARETQGVSTGRDRILIQVEQGLRELTSEIHIRHENDTLGVPAPDGLLDIEPLVSDFDLAETEVLSELGAYIAAKVSEQTVSLVGGEIAGQPKSELGLDQTGDPVLWLHLDEERAWATVGQALANAQVDVTDVDRDRGLYYVVIPRSIFLAEEEGGLLSGWFGDDDDVHELILTVRQDAADLHSVLVSEGEAQAADPELSQQVLVLLREFAS